MTDMIVNVADDIQAVSGAVDLGTGRTIARVAAMMIVLSLLALLLVAFVSLATGSAPVSVLGGLLDWLRRSAVTEGTISPGDVDLLSLTDDPEEAVALAATGHGTPPNHNAG